MKHLVLSIFVLSIFPTIAFGQINNASENSNKAGISGTQNSTLGKNSGVNNRSKDNVFVGFNSGGSNNGKNNTFIGSQSGVLSTGSGNVFLGYLSGMRANRLSNLLFIENSSSNTPLIWGDFASDIVNINGKLGVGIQSPQEKLHVNGNVRGNQKGGALRIKTTGGYIDIGSQNSAWAHIYTDRTRFIFNKDVYSVTSGFSSYVNKDLTLKTYGTTRLTINNATGNVGIGTIAPAEKLDVNGTTKSKRLVVDSNVTSSLLELNGPLSSRLDYSVDTGTNSSLKMTDQANKIRFNISVLSGGGSFAKLLTDNNGNDAFTISEGTLLGSLMFMPKAKSRIVIGDLGGYLFNEGHKLVVKEGSAKIEGDIITNSKVGVGVASTDIPVDYKLAVAGRIIGEEVRVELLNTWPDYVFKDNYDLPSLKEVEKHIHQKGHLLDIPSAIEVENNGLLLGEMNAKLLQKIEELTLYTIQQEKEIQIHKANNKSLENRLDKIEIAIQAIKNQ